MSRSLLRELFEAVGFVLAMLGVLGLIWLAFVIGPPDSIPTPRSPAGIPPAGAAHPCGAGHLSGE